MLLSTMVGYLCRTSKAKNIKNNYENMHVPEMHIGNHSIKTALTRPLNYGYSMPSLFYISPDPLGNTQKKKKRVMN